MAVSQIFNVQGLEQLQFPQEGLERQVVVITSRSGSGQTARSKIDNKQYLVTLQEFTDYIIERAITTSSKWDIRDNNEDRSDLLGFLNFVGPGVSVVENEPNNELEVRIIADMEKSVYDTNDDGIVDSSAKVEGVDTAGALKYYGTDLSGTPGFYDNSGAVAGHIIQDDRYVPATGGINNTSLEKRLFLRFGPEFNVEDGGASSDFTYVEETSYATNLDAFIPSVEVGGFPSGVTVGDTRGKPYLELFDQIIFPAVSAVYTDPTAELAVDSTSFFLKNGIITNTEFTSSFFQNDAGNVSSYALRQNGIPIDSTLTGNPVIVTIPVQVFLPGNTTSLIVTFDTQFSYGQGIQLTDSHGNPSGLPIPSGSILTNGISYKVIFPYYFGTSANGIPNQSEINGATEVIEDAGQTQTVQVFSAVDQHVFVAVPGLEPPDNFTYVYWLGEDGNSGIIGPNSFINRISIPIADPQGAWNKSYDVYYSTYPSQFAGNLTLSVTDVDN